MCGCGFLGFCEMSKCKKFLVFAVWLTIGVVECKPRFKEYNFRRIREVANSSEEAVTNFPMFHPQLPTVSADPKCAENLTFCEDIDSYPYTHLKYVLERDPSFRSIFTEEDAKEAKEELVNRQGSDGTFICRSVTRTVFPKVGKNKNNKWKFIVNQDNFLQGVRVETCHRPDYPCDIIEDLRSGYTTLCRQKYIYSRLLSLNDKGRPSPDTFKLPSACCCAYTRNNFYLRQFGSSVSPIIFTPKP